MIWIHANGILKKNQFFFSKRPEVPTELSKNWKMGKRATHLQLHETGEWGAEGKSHFMVLNSGEAKRVLMGSLAGPESPSPWSQRMKLRAAAIGPGSGGVRVCVRVWRWTREEKREVAVSVRTMTAKGFIKSGKDWTKFITR